jgi:hypothetical protein
VFESDLKSCCPLHNALSHSPKFTFAPVLLQDAERINHSSTCPAATPPSSPLDSPPPPAPAPAAPIPAHYISSLRASSRRGGVSPEKERDPLSRLLRFLRAFYRELAGRDSAHPPPWAPPLPPGTLCPAHFQPSLQLAPLGTGGRAENEARDTIRLDQLLSAIRVISSQCNYIITTVCFARVVGSHLQWKCAALRPVALITQLKS